MRGEAQNLDGIEYTSTLCDCAGKVSKLLTASRQATMPTLLLSYKQQFTTAEDYLEAPAMPYQLCRHRLINRIHLKIAKRRIC